MDLRPVPGLRRRHDKSPRLAPWATILRPSGFKGKGRRLRAGPGLTGLSAYAVRCVSVLSPLIAACAAARRAMGTRNGEQDT